MGILYGAMIAKLIPTLIAWWTLPTALAPTAPPISRALTVALLAMAAGVSLSGLRDLYAALELRGSGWPWNSRPRAEPKR
jgi:hypothetical protein